MRGNPSGTRKNRVNTAPRPRIISRWTQTRVSQAPVPSPPWSTRRRSRRSRPRSPSNRLTGRSRERLGRGAARAGRAAGVRADPVGSVRAGSATVPLGARSQVGSGAGRCATWSWPRRATNQPALVAALLALKCGTVPTETERRLRRPPRPTCPPPSRPGPRRTPRNCSPDCRNPSVRA